MKEHILLEKAFRYTELMHIEPPAGYAYQPQRGYWANINTGEAMMMGDDPRPMQTKNVTEKREKIKKVNSINHLIISSTIDYSTDLVCCELEKRGLSYLRLNRDTCSDYHLSYDLTLDALSVEIDGSTYLIEASKLISVFFRAPVFLRNMGKLYTLKEQLQRSQWSSFLRNLIVFDRAKWINHPVSTYNAENKLY